MSETGISLLLVAAEFGLVVSVVFGVFLYLQARSRRRDREQVFELVARLKQGAADHEAGLVAALTEIYGLEAEAAGDKARELIDQERSLYRRVLRLFLGRDRMGLGGFDEALRALVQAYRELSEGNGSDAEDGATPPSTPLMLRKENAALRERVRKLETDLGVTMATMENMIAEYASMYEGGHKEGEKRMKNEVYRLRQQLAGNAPDAGEEAIPELKDKVDD